MNEHDLPSVAIVGGGLAGMAAALRLREQGCHVELFEARRTLGGRAASYRDPQSGELIDHCQHVAMACCTNFHNFCERTGIASEFERFSTLHFFDRAGHRYDLQASRWLPAPLHLGPSFLRQHYLPLRDRLSMGWVLWKLARTSGPETAASPTIGQWLRQQGVSQVALDRFWSVVLVSALGETVDNASLTAARKVFVDGFMSHVAGYAVDVPKQSLRALFDERVGSELTRRGVVVHRNAPIEALTGEGAAIRELLLPGGEERRFDAYVLATTWRQAGQLLSPASAQQLPQLIAAQQIDASPISGVHLWFDRALTPLPHAVLVDRLSQWVFRREVAADARHYYQVVISASRDLRGLSTQTVIDTVLSDLQAIFPAAREAKLLQHKLVTERDAVFSYRPGLDADRPAQATSLSNLFLAGDWTQTCWPSTMEGAVRSGYLAAEAILRSHGCNVSLLTPDLPRGWLARWLLGT